MSAPVFCHSCSALVDGVLVGGGVTYHLTIVDGGWTEMICPQTLTLEAFDATARSDLAETILRKLVRAATSFDGCFVWNGPDLILEANYVPFDAQEKAYLMKMRDES